MFSRESSFFSGATECSTLCTKKSVCTECLVALCAGEGEDGEGEGEGEGRGGERERERKGTGGAGECAGYAHCRGRDTVGRLFVAEKGEGKGEGEGEGEGEGGERKREMEKIQNKKLPWSSVSHC